MRLRLILAAAAASLLSACAHNPVPQSDLRLYAMDCGRMANADMSAFADDGAYNGQRRDMVVSCFLIRHPAGDLLWDSGLPEALAASEGADTPFGRMTMARSLTAQLADLGLTPADIDYVSVSHSHTDHAGNLGLFAQSTWIVDADERAHMFRDAARADARSFAPYAAMENVRPILIEGEGDYDVFGDGSVTIIQTPGHTPGHTVLLLRLPQTGPVLLSGDLYHFTESRTERRVPSFNADRAQTLASMDKFERIAAETGARVIIQHVPADFAALPAFPEPLR